MADRSSTKETCSTPELLSTTAIDKLNTHATGRNEKRGWGFWLIIGSLVLSEFICALDSLIVAVALPTIVNELQGTNFVWIVNAYTVAASAFMPWAGSLAAIFGRRPVFLSALVFFLVGSGVSGGAKDMTMLIAGRALQGLGTGIILALSEIIVGDLVPVAERGVFYGIFAAAWAIAASAGPPIGGLFAENVSWRWIFWINLPICGVVSLIVLFGLNLPTPPTSLREKIRRIDWIGNIMIVGGCTSAIIGLSWAGTRYSWESVEVLLPVMVGVLSLCGAVWYEAKVPKEPTIPFGILSTRSTVAGFVGTGLHAIVVSATGLYFPIYFQACKLASPIQSSVYTLAIAFVSTAAAILSGASVTTLKRYVPQNVLGWIFFTAGMGSWMVLEPSSGPGKWLGLQFLAGMGGGMLYIALSFPVIAGLPLELHPPALAFFAFARQFSMTWGSTIGSTILQNELKRRLPSEFLSSFSGDHVELAYSAIPLIPSLDPALRFRVQEAFAESLRWVWVAMCVISGVGLLVSLCLQEFPMATETDEAWRLPEDKRADPETPESS